MRIKNKIILKISIISFFVFANALDFYSTIIQSPSAEENPIVRFLWYTYGGITFFLFKLILTFLAVLIVCKMKRMIYYIALFVLALVILLVALTNLALIPIGWTSWLVF